MNINLKEYQREAIDDLIYRNKKLLDKNEKGKICVFQAPTGSGKTIIVAKFIEELIKELFESDLCFIWVSPGKGELHKQSKRSLDKIFDGAPRVSLLESEFSGSRERIVQNEVVIVNWEKIRNKDGETGEWKNTLMKDGERVNFRDVLEKTREQRKIILIIDESQVGFNAERANEIREIINADLTLEVSATPILTSKTDEIIKVGSNEVIEQGMIKKEIIINEGIDDVKAKDSQDLILEASYQKRLKLKDLFKKEKSNINPLVLIQIPTSEAGEDKIKVIKQFLNKKGITEENRKLAIWMSEKKTPNLEWIEENDSEVEFLIFKQAIDTGWDCPRAHILVKFREIRSEIFEIQTVGRILRMPEQKHYFEEDLNQGYIFTNIESIIVKKEDYNPNIIKTLKSVRKDVYKNINLKSYYKKRADYGDITSSFNNTLRDVFCRELEIDKKDEYSMSDKNEKKLKKQGIVIDLKKYEQELILDAKIDVKSFDEINGAIDSDKRINLEMAGNDIQDKFEQVIKNNLGSFKNIKRSVPAVKTAIYVWFQKYLGSKNWREQIIMIQKIFLSPENLETFEGILLKAVEEYQATKNKEVNEKIKASEKLYQFNIESISFHNPHTEEEMSHKKYVCNPCYLNTERSKPEKEFEKYLEENSDKIVWWWKNGENKQTYFGIKYIYEKKIRTFYPDYLVQSEDGRLGIFEVKEENDRDGKTLTKAKAEELQSYIKKQNNPNLFGGIVIKKSNSWKLNNKGKYVWEKCEKNDWTDWTKLKNS